MNLKTRLALRKGEDADRGDLVQTVLLIAGFAIVAILIVTWIGTAILNKGSDAASCIQNTHGPNTVTSTYAGTSGMPNYTPQYNVTSSDQEACGQNAASTHGFQSDSGYSARYSNGN